MVPPPPRSLAGAGLLLLLPRVTEPSHPKPSHWRACRRADGWSEKDTQAGGRRILREEYRDPKRGTKTQRNAGVGTETQRERRAESAGESNRSPEFREFEIQRPREGAAERGGQRPGAGGGQRPKNRGTEGEEGRATQRIRASMRNIPLSYRVPALLATSSLCQDSPPRQQRAGVRDWVTISRLPQGSPSLPVCAEGLSISFGFFCPACL